MSTYPGYDHKPSPAIVFPLQVYFSAMDQVSQGMGPLKSLARTPLEMMSFASQRAQAYIDIPARMGYCRTPSDLLREQTRFWQVACDQYAECSRRLTESWLQALIPAPGLAMPQPSQASKRPSHDYVAVVPLAPSSQDAAQGRRRALSAA
jgi:hypothetical protein